MIPARYREAECSSVPRQFFVLLYSQYAAPQEENKLADSFHPNHHFAPKKNWINDPNGLVFHDGIYELYYQHNPNDITWDDMNWGHARSRDLIHWEEMETALTPDEDGAMFSGCAIRNDRGLPGLPKDALIYYYTAAGGTTPESAGRTFTVRLAYSLDGGKTIVKTHEMVTEPLARENRDPKVFWHEASSAYIMVLYIEGHDFGIFRSEDLRHFTLSQRVTLDGGFECPGFFPLSVRNDPDAGIKWVFWAADGSYYVGSFDGYRFEQQQECRMAYADGKHSIAYAAQTWSGLPKGTVRQIAWLMTGNIAGIETHCMSFPRDLFLMRVPGKFPGDPDEFHLGMELPDMVEKKFEARGTAEKPGDEIRVCDGTVRLGIHASGAFDVVLRDDADRTIFHLDFRPQKGFLLYGADQCMKIVQIASSENLEVLYDRGIVEISADEGLTTLVTDYGEERGLIPAKAVLRKGEQVKMEASVIPADE